MKNYVITIARGFGSGGKEFAVKLGERLGIQSYEHRILELASQYSGIRKEKFEAADEKLNISKIRQALSDMPQKMDIMAPTANKFVLDVELYNIQAHIIRELAANESCIIVGKCADCVLRENSNVISLYIEATRPYCRKRIMELYHVNADEADRMIYQTDTYRADYYKFYSGGNYWTNVTNYDLTIDIERTGIEEALDLVEFYVRRKFQIS